MFKRDSKDTSKPTRDHDKKKDQEIEELKKQLSKAELDSKKVNWKTFQQPVNCKKIHWLLFNDISCMYFFKRYDNINSILVLKCLWS